MRSANEKKMFDLLLDEIEDTLQDIEQRCLKLESSQDTKELQIIFRSAHNVKGAAQLYGLNEFGAFVHTFEDLLSTLQKSERPINASSIDMLLKAHAFLLSWVQTLREQEKHVPDSSAIKAMIAQHVEDLKSNRVASSSGAAPGANEKEAAKSKAPKAPGAPANAEAAKSEVASGPTKTADASTTKPATTPAAPPASDAPADGGGRSARAKRSSGTLRIPSQKIDEIMQLIGELSIHQGILWHNYQHGTFNLLTCKNAVVLNHKTLKDLYGLVLTLRMQTVETLFQRIERTARDIAREQKKTITVQLTGADTPLDKTVIELITDPMMHLVRNAIDHGIEDDETRAKIGKPVPSKISIHTQQDTRQVLISISDDGRGLDPQLILEKAIKKGLVPASAKLRDDEIIQLIFLPGFSTRDQVTAISGRGVGMDVVQKAVQQLGGRIEISSKKGEGTGFEISLPASLEIIEGLLIRVENHHYIVPRQDVAEIIDLEFFEVEKFGDRGRAIRMRDQVIPVETLADYIGFSKSGPHAPTDNSRQIALLIRLPDNTKLGLCVDAVLAQQQIVVRPLTEELAKLPGFTGVTILGSGEPAMILSVTAIGESYLRWIQTNENRGGGGNEPKLGESA